MPSFHTDSVPHGQHTRSTFQTIWAIRAIHRQLLIYDLPFLDQLTTLVLRQEHENQAELREMRIVFVQLMTALTAHLNREDRIVYPTLLRQETDMAPISLAIERVADTLQEHKQILAIFGHLRQLTNQYRPDYKDSQEIRLTYEKLLTVERTVIDLFDFEQSEAYDGFTA